MQDIIKSAKADGFKEGRKCYNQEDAEKKYVGYLSWRIDMLTANKISSIEGLITDDTWSASTVRSGSAIVINKPNAKHTTTSSKMFFDFVNPEPTYSPIGVIARSAPKLNRPIPKINITDEIIKTIISLLLKLIKGVKFKSITINVTGITETNASFTFNKNWLFIDSPPYLIFHFVYFTIFDHFGQFIN